MQGVMALGLTPFSIQATPSNTYCLFSSHLAFAAIWWHPFLQNSISLTHSYPDGACPEGLNLACVSLVEIQREVGSVSGSALLVVNSYPFML